MDRSRLDREAAQRQAAIAAHRTSEERFHQLVQSELIGIAFFNSDDRVTDANNTFLSLVGFTRDDLEKARIRLDRLTPPEWMAVAREKSQELHATGCIQQYEQEYVRKDGTRFWGLFGASTLGQSGERIAFLLDVTKRKHAEESLRQTREQLQLITDTMPAYVSRCSRDGRFVWVNRRYSERFGKSPEQVAGRPIIDVLGPEAMAAIEPYVRRVLTGEMVEYEAELNYRDFGRSWMRVAYAPTFDRDGVADGWVAIITDVGQRKQLETALRDSEHQLRHLAETVPSIVWTAAPDGTITYANPRWYDYCGITPEQNARYWPRLVLHPDDRDRCEKEWNRALAEGREYEIEVRNRRYDGVYRWFVTRAVPQLDTDGKVVSWFGVTTDIHDQKEMQLALRRRNEHLGLLSEAAGVLLSTAEPDAMLHALFAKIAPSLGLDTYFNFMVNETGDALRLESYAGVSVETARTITRLEFGQAVCGTVAVQRQPIVATNIQQSDDPKVQLVRGFGIRAYACNPLMTGERLLGTLSFASRTRDRFDDDELEFIATLSHYITAAYERLDLIRQLREADRRKDEFLATLAHELRNPLAPIRNSVQIMSLVNSLDPALARARDVIERQVRQMTRLVDDLLDVSRITRGKIQLQRLPTDLASIIRDAVETTSPTIVAAGHELQVSLPSTAIQVDADHVRLSQVFANLLHNAAKYTEPGGRISLAVEPNATEVAIHVRDNGIGISAEHLPRLFEMFSQVAPAIERSQGGLGIGLSLVKGLIDLHGGRVEAQSDGPGMGSVFTVRLPIIQREAPDIPAPIPNGSFGNPTLETRSILIVDDNRDAAESLCALLRFHGHDVRCAFDGQEAVEVATLLKPNVILLDIGMPRLNGYEVAQLIRQNDWGRDIVLIATTGWGQDEDKRRAEEAGFDHHMTKPVDPALLIATLANLHS
jgi:PAS domain S-box-containing protein